MAFIFYPCCYVMNTFVSPATSYSPFEVVFLRKPPDITEFDFDPNIDGLSLEATEYMKLLTKQISFNDKG